MQQFEFDAARECAEAFLQFDSGSKGYLTRHEYRVAHIAVLGHPPSVVELDTILPKRMNGAAFPLPLPCATASDVHDELSMCVCFLIAGIEAGVDLPRFCELMDQRLMLQEPDEVVRRAFRVFDSNAKGYISAQDFENAMASVAPHLPHDVIALVFSEIDADRDGVFTLIMRIPHNLKQSSLQAILISHLSTACSGRVSFKDFHAMMMTPRPGYGTTVGPQIPTSSSLRSAMNRTCIPPRALLPSAS